MRTGPSTPCLLHPCRVDTAIFQGRQREPHSKDVAGLGLYPKPQVQAWLWGSGVQVPRQPGGS